MFADTQAIAAANTGFRMECNVVITAIVGKFNRADGDTSVTVYAFLSDDIDN